MELSNTSKKVTPFHGTTYQIKLLLLYLKRGLDHDYDFLLGTEINEAGKFDDVVFRIREENGQVKYRFLQCKHSSSDTSLIKLKDLIKEGGPFSLPDYFKSYVDIRNKSEFQEESVKEFVICTNKLFHVEQGNVLKEKSGLIHLEELQERDKILDFNETKEFPSAKRYKIKDIQHPVKLKMLRGTDFGNLAYQLVNDTLKNANLDFNSDLYKRYHVALSYHKIIDISSQKFHDDFVQNQNLSREGRAFRETFIEIAKLEKLLESQEVFWKKISSRYLNFPDWFGHTGESVNGSSGEIMPLDELGTFLNRLIFAVGQPNDQQLDELIRSELREKYDLIDSYFVACSIENFILDWMKDRHKTFVSNDQGKSLFKDIDQKLALAKLTCLKMEYKCSFEKDGNYFNDLDSLKAFVQSSSQFLVIQTDCIKLTSLKVFQTLQSIDKYRNCNEYVIMKYTSMMKFYKDAVMKAFKEVGCALFIAECDCNLQQICASNISNVLIDIVKKYPEKRLVFITNNDEALKTLFEYVNVTAEFQTDNNSSISEVMKKVIEKKEINFKGQKVIFTELLQKTCTTISELSFSPSVILRLIENEDNLNVGQFIGPLNDKMKYYINRTLIQKPVLNDDLIKSTFRSDDRFLIFDKQSLDQLQKSSEKALKILKNAKTFEEFITAIGSTKEQWKPSIVVYAFVNSTEEPFRKFKELTSKFPNYNVHLLKIEEEQLLWHRSSRSISSLKRCFTDVKLEYLEEDLLCGKSGQRLLSIVDSPGMGKSTILSHVSQTLKQKFPHFWVILIKLDSYQKCLNELKDIDLDITINFISECENLIADFEKQLLHNCIMKSDNAIILLDALDEITDNAQSTVIKMLEELCKTRVRQIWLTSRPHLLTKIEEHFPTVSYDMKPLSENEQCQFLEKYWKLSMHLDDDDDVKLGKLKRFVSAVIDHFSSVTKDLVKKFVGIPLQAQMLAEVLQSKCDEFCSSSIDDPSKMLQNTYYNLFNVYKSFMESKFTVFKKKTSEENLTNRFAAEQANSHLKRMSDMHGQLAFSLLFPQKSITDLPVQKLDLSYMLNCGIIQKTKDNREEFVHRTFAEFWASSFFSAHLQYSKQLKDFVTEHILTDNYELLKIFLDGHLATEPIHLQAISGEMSDPPPPTLVCIFYPFG